MSAAPVSDVVDSHSVAPGAEIPPEVAAEATMQRRKRFGRFVVGAVAIAAPILAVAAIYLSLRWTGHRSAEEALARARAAGDPLSVAEMDAYYPTSHVIEEATRHWRRAGEIVEHPSFRASTAGVPILGAGMDRPQGDALLAPETVPAATAFLQKFHGAIDEAHAARRAGAVARFPLDFGDGISMRLPHLQNQRTLVNLLELDLEANVLAGDADAVVEDLLSMIAVCDSLANEPVYTSQLIRLACLSVAAEATERTLLRLELREDQLATLQEAFARQQFRDGLQRSARSEQFFLANAIRSDEPTGDPTADRLRIVAVQSADLARGLNVWRNVIDESGEGLAEGLVAAEALEQESTKLRESRVDRVRFATTAAFLPAMEGMPWAFVRGEADARIAATALACERYRLKRRRYPASLRDLVPEFLPAVPEEPLATTAVRYVSDESEALIYSVGVDRQDDGGHSRNGDLPFHLKAHEHESSEERP